VILVHDILRCHPLLPGTDGNGNAMFIGSPYKTDFPARQTQVTYINVGRNIHTGKVSDMNRPVGIGQGRCDQVTLEFFLLHRKIVYLFQSVQLAGK